MKFPVWYHGEGSTFSSALPVNHLETLVSYSKDFPDEFDAFVMTGRKITSLKFDDVLKPGTVSVDEHRQAYQEFETKCKSILINSDREVVNILQDMFWAIGW